MTASEVPELADAFESGDVLVSNAPLVAVVKVLAAVTPVTEVVKALLVSLVVLVIAE